MRRQAVLSALNFMLYILQERIVLTVTMCTVQLINQYSLCKQDSLHDNCFITQLNLFSHTVLGVLMASAMLTLDSTVKLTEVHDSYDKVKIHVDSNEIYFPW